MTDLRQRTETPPTPRPRSRMEYGRGFWLKLTALALVDAIAIYSAIVLIADGAWLFLAALVIGAIFVNWVYLSPNTGPLRWTAPGLVFMVAFLVIPILYTFYVSFTNWATGNVLNKAQVIEILESRVFTDPDDPGELFDLYVFRNDDEEIRFLLVADDGELLFGEPRGRTEEPLEPLDETPADLGIVDDDGDGVPEEIGGYRLLSTAEVFQLANTLQFDQLIVDVERGEVQVLGLSEGRVVLASQQFFYDADRDVLRDAVNDQVCSVGDTEATLGNFVCEDGRVLDPGWVAVVGLRNYSDIATNPAIREPFVGVFVWNLVFAAGSVFLTFALGLGLAITMQHDRFRGRTFFRSVYILPYAVPAFLSIFIWQGLLNTDFGQVNSLLSTFGLGPVPWLTDDNWAKVAVLLVNTWLGFPYMFLISTGALQAIPAELQEAARVDGAGGFGVFRRITFPMLMVSLAPLLIGSFAFNFNNFAIIYFLTVGGPPILDAAVPVGATDILITFTYDLAIAGGRGNQFGLGAAITVFIFFIVLVISSIGFRFTRRLEDIYGNI